MNTELRYKTDEIIEDIQQATVEAGGRFLRQAAIKKMTVEDLLHLLLPNGIEFNIGHPPEHVEHV